MENERTPQISVQQREISEITADIKELCRQATNIVLGYAIEIGRRLVEAKSVLPFGAWGDWLKNEVNFSQSTANNYMKLFEEYGNEQISLFGAVAKSQTIGNLPYTKALQLLAIPADERESFAQEVKAEELSVSELKDAIKARTEAEKQAAEEKARADKLEELLGAAELAADEADRRASEAEAQIKRTEDLEKELAEAKQKITDTEKALKDAKDNPQVPKKVLNKLKTEAEAAAKAVAEKDLEQKLKDAYDARDKAIADAKEAQRRADKTAEELDAAKTSLRTASPEVAAFKAIFGELQKMGNTAIAHIKKMEDPDVAERCRAALKAFADSLQGF